MWKVFFTNKRFILLIVFCGAVLLIFFLHENKLYAYTEMLTQKYIDKNTKYVLYWTPFWFHKDYKIGFGHKPFEHCEYKNCLATNNRTLIRLEDFSAIIFHASIYNRKEHGVPSVRLPNQIYIFSNVEAPIYLCPNLKQYSSFFNWTMTYRFDSDIVSRHGTIREENSNYSMLPDDLLKKKTKLAAWFVSHCKTDSAREELTKKIQEFIPVDVYGNCGKLNCARKKGDSKLSAAECYDMVEQNYKFYFSFENSYCQDYSTEKLYNVLQKNLVPIVYGGGDYNLSAPPKSVINVADFQSVRELVDYLLYLDQNMEEYLKYFQWKKNYRVVDSDVACQICRKLHEPIEESIYNDLHKWWWEKDQPMCKTGKGLPSIVSDILPKK